MMYEWSWDRANQWHWLVKSGLVLFLSLLWFVAGYWLVVRPTRNDYRQEVLEVAALRQQWETKQHKASLLTLYRQKQNLLQKGMINKMEWLSMSYGWSGLWGDIVNEGHYSHVMLKSVIPQAEKKHVFYRELPIKIITTGPYASLVMFLNRVATTTRLLVVNDFSIKKQNEQLVMSLDVSAYQATEVTVVPKQPSVLPDHVVIKTPRRDLFQKEAFSLATLQWVGMLRQGSKVWALLKSPNGTLTRVGVGDEIGNHHDKVVAINDNVMKIESIMLTQGMAQKKEMLMPLGEGLV